MWYLTSSLMNNSICLKFVLHKKKKLLRTNNSTFFQAP